VCKIEKTGFYAKIDVNFRQIDPNALSIILKKKCQNYYKFYNEKFTNLTRILLLLLKKYNK